MNEQEKSVLQGFLHELESVRLERKDMQADALIRQAAQAQPDALYLLTQRALLQGQALQDMQQQVANLQEQVRQLQQARDEPQSSGGFLDAASQWGKSGTALANPAVLAPAAPPASGYPPATAAPQAASAAPQAAAAPGAGMFGGAGGTFLGSMAGMMAGAAAGHFLYQGMEHMVHKNTAQDTQAGSQRLGDVQAGQGGNLPADNALARDAGVNDVGNASQRGLAQFEDTDAGQDSWSDSSADGSDFTSGDDNA